MGKHVGRVRDEGHQLVHRERDGTRGFAEGFERIGFVRERLPIHRPQHGQVADRLDRQGRDHKRATISGRNRLAEVFAEGHHPLAVQPMQCAAVTTKPPGTRTPMPPPLATCTMARAIRVATGALSACIAFLLQQRRHRHAEGLGTHTGLHHMQARTGNPENSSTQPGGKGAGGIGAPWAGAHAPRASSATAGTIQTPDPAPPAADAAHDSNRVTGTPRALARALIVLKEGSCCPASSRVM